MSDFAGQLTDIRATVNYRCDVWLHEIWLSIFVITFRRLDYKVPTLQSVTEGYTLLCLVDRDLEQFTVLELLVAAN